MLASAIVADVSVFINQHITLKSEDGQAVSFRNGNLPGRTIQPGISDIEVDVLKVRVRSGSGININSRLVPPYLNRTKSIEVFLLWLYLQGISPGYF
ncbi:MAG: hypothetical protein ABL903_07800 [Methylococcales bacterium]